MTFVLSFALPYLIGSIPFSYILARIIAKKDLRYEGSGNLGARNSLDIGGIKVGLPVFILDVLKGYLSLMLVGSLFNNYELIYIAAFAVILGHNFPVYLKFHGGKGLAAGLGIFAYINPQMLFWLLFIAAVSFLITKKANPSAMIAVIFLPLLFFAFQKDYYSILTGVVISFLILIKHKKDYQDFISIFKR